MDSQIKDVRAVLVVDDDASSRTLLRMTMEAEGLTALEARDGVEALEVLQRHKVDAVISDILMPRMDGFRLCQELRKSERFDHLAIIFYTATYVSPADEKLALDFGVDRYLRKPCPAAVLVRALRECTIKGKTCGRHLPSLADEMDVMREYSEALVRKLEERNVELECASEELRQKRELLEVTMTSIGDAVITADTAGRVTFLNPAAEKLTGWSQVEAMQQPVRLVFRTLNEQTRLPVIDIIERVLREGVIVGPGDHVTVIARDGRESPIENCAAPIRDGAGHVRGVVLVFRDMTARRHAERVHERDEERIRHQNAILEAMNRVFADALLCDTEEELGRKCLTVAEQVTQSKFGFIGEISDEGHFNAVAISDAAWEVFRIGDASGWKKPPKGLRIQGIHGRVMLDGKGFYTNDPASHPDSLGVPEGHPPLNAFLGVPLKHDGKTIGMIAVGNCERGYCPQDLEALEDLAGAVLQVWRQKRAELAARTSEEQLRQAQKMESVGRLAGSIAHDFNNLLTVINGYSDVMLRRLNERDPLHHSLLEIRKAGESAATLTQQLLAVSRTQIASPRLLNMNLLVSDARDMLQRLVGEDIEVVTDLAPALGQVLANPSQLKQMLMNLVVNARDAMPSGGQITIETTDVELDERFAEVHPGLSPGPYVLLVVTDTGIGMDKETQRRIFEPFFTTKGEGEGTGLGLSIVYGIVRQLGGWIGVYSEPGHGAAFHIHLPRTDAVVPDAEALSREPGTLQGSETVLLVEDQEEVRALAAEVLRSYGYQVLDAAQGGDALRLAESHPGKIHLMVTDVVMPRMTGKELAEHLKPIRPEMRVLYMSGYTKNAIAHRGVLAPSVNYIAKPFAPDALAAKVREVLDVPPGRPLILIADDSELIRRILTEILEDAGYEVLGAADGGEALEHLRTAPVQIAVMDKDIPGQSGLNAARDVRRARPDVKIVLMSATFAQEQSFGPEGWGVDAVLAKPMEPAKLLDVIRNMMMHRPGAQKQ